MKYHQHSLSLSSRLDDSCIQAYFPSPPSRIRIGHPIMLLDFSSCVNAGCCLLLRPTSANPNLRQHSPDTRLHQKLFQRPGTSHLSYRANRRRETAECTYHLAFSAVIQEERGGRNSRPLKLGRMSSDGRIVADSA